MLTAVAVAETSVTADITYTAYYSQADLRLTLTPVGTFTQGQTGARYSIVVTNHGTGPTSGTVTMDVTRLSDSLTPTELDGGVNWHCNKSTLTCTITDELAGNGGAYDPITLTVNVAPTAPITVATTVRVAGGGDTDTTNNTATDHTPIIQKADLAVRLTHDGNVQRGRSDGRFRITVSNGGGTATMGKVSVTDSLPAGMTAKSISGPGWTCNVSLPQAQGGSCGRSDPLPAGGSYPPITLIVAVAEGAPATLTNVVQVAGGGQLNLANDSASDEITFGAEADLTIRTSHTGLFAAGQPGTYTLTVRNSGAGPTSGTVTVTDRLPEALVYDDASGTNWTCGAEGQTVTCTSAEVVAAGADYPAITLTVLVSENAPPTIANWAEVSGGGDRNTGNNTATDEVRVAQLVDLTVKSSHEGRFTQGQPDAGYTLTVTNHGSGPTRGLVTVTDTLPLALTPQPWSDDGWTCAISGQTGQISGQTVECTRSDALAAGDSYPPIMLPVAVAPTAPATVTNVATVAGGGDVSPGNNQASDPTSIIPVADLTISTRHTGIFRRGEIGEYTLVVKNVGQGATDGSAVTVTDTLPTGLTLNSFSVPGHDWDCTATDQSLTCTRSDQLGAFRSYSPITLKVRVAVDAPAQVSNEAQVSGGGQVNVANDAASDVTAIGQVADLTVAVTHSGNFVKGQTGTYTLTVTNAGEGSTDARVTLADTLSPGMTAMALGGQGWTCNLATVTCTRADVLAAGRSYPVLTLTVRIASQADGSGINAATVSGGGEANVANNTASDPTTIVPAALVPVVPPKRR